MRSVSVLFGLFVASFVVAAGCGSSGDDGNTKPGGPGNGVDLFADGGGGSTGPAACKNLQCRQVACPSGGTTTVTGVVTDPAGKVPLYNVLVYVPNAPLAPIPTGASCDRCESTISGEPIATALTNTKGEFSLENVPVGANVPLVIQIGKWRREITLPTVPECTTTPVTDKQLTRLPKNQSEGHIPKIALTTGGQDSLECLFRKIGIDDVEFTPPTGTGRINFYKGHQGSPGYATNVHGGQNFGDAQPFWESEAQLKSYDLLFLSCDGVPWDNEDNDYKTPQAVDAMHKYMNAGGRVFASHWHSYWFKEGPAPAPQVATFQDHPDLPIPFVADIDQSFPKGKAFAEWLVNVDGQSPLGKISINEAQYTVTGSSPQLAQKWISSASPASVQYLTANTPLGAAPEAQCGRFALTDIHVSSGDDPGDRYPEGCDTTELSAQEKALEFMLFDLSSCILADNETPTAPPPGKIK